MPVASMELGESPTDALQCQTLSDNLVFRYLPDVVITDEVEMRHLPIDCKNRAYENRKDKKVDVLEPISLGKHVLFQPFFTTHFCSAILNQLSCLLKLLP